MPDPMSTTTTTHPSCAPSGSVPCRNQHLQVPLFIYANAQSVLGISATLHGFERITGENHVSIKPASPAHAVQGRLIWVEEDFLRTVDFRGLIKGINEGTPFHRFLATIKPVADIPAIERCWVFQAAEDATPDTAATSSTEWVRDLHGQPKDDLLALTQDHHVPA